MGTSDPVEMDVGENAEGGKDVVDEGGVAFLASANGKSEELSSFWRADPSPFMLELARSDCHCSISAMETVAPVDVGGVMLLC